MSIAQLIIPSLSEMLCNAFPDPFKIITSTNTENKYEHEFVIKYIQAMKLTSTLSSLTFILIRKLGIVATFLSTCKTRIMHRRQSQHTQILFCPPLGVHIFFSQTSTQKSLQRSITASLDYAIFSILAALKIESLK